VHEFKDFKMKVIGIYSKNRTEWNETDMGCVLYGITTIPLYDTLGPESISHVLNNSSITSLFCN
jgi:long-chain acyl-CoA synthetase